METELIWGAEIYTKFAAAQFPPQRIQGDKKSGTKIITNVWKKLADFRAANLILRIWKMAQDFLNQSDRDVQRLVEDLEDVIRSPLDSGEMASVKQENWLTFLGIKIKV